jgi:hypothetical protein
MRRREFIAGFGATTAWPLVARAQQKSMPVIGYLNVGFPQLQHPFVVAFHEGLKETGFIAGENLAIEYRWAEERYDRLPELAADLVRRKVEVIVATGELPLQPRQAQPRQSPSSSQLVATQSRADWLPALPDRMATLPGSQLLPPSWYPSGSSLCPSCFPKPRKSLCS